MTFTNHVLTGGLLGLLPQPLLLVPAGLASHVVLDSLPHIGKLTRKQFNIVLIADIIVGLAAWVTMILVWPSAWLPISVGVTAAAAPDLQWYPKLKGKPAWLPKLARFHGWVQWGERRWGFIPELAWSGLIISLLASNLPRG